MHKNPLISVLMTAYNADRFVGQAIESILAQTYSNFELIIVDDHSTDKTYNIARTFARKDKRIKLIRLPQNVGPSKASNVGIKKAQGVFLARMDADDISFPDRFKKQITFLLKYSDVAVVGGQCDLIDEDGNFIGEKHYPTSHKDLYDALFRMNPIQHPSCMVNLNLVSKEDLLGDNFGLLAHDLDMVFKLSLFGKLANMDDTVLQYRQYKSSLSLRHPKKTFLDTVRVRHNAVVKYHYRPSLKGMMIHTLQVIVVGILPEPAIYPLFAFLRYKKRVIAKTRAHLKLAWNMA